MSDSNLPVGAGNGYYWLDMRVVENSRIPEENTRYPQPAAWSGVRQKWLLLGAGTTFEPEELLGARVLGNLVPPEYPE
jgi:hypothetical protein